MMEIDRPTGIGWQSRPLQTWEIPTMSHMYNVQVDQNREVSLQDGCLVSLQSKIDFLVVWTDNSTN